MELRQLRYFVRIVEAGSMSRAALDMDMAQSALSQQISRLEGELSTRLLQRSPQGVTPTEAGLAFFRDAKLTLRYADQAIRSAQQARLSGSVSIGLAPTTSAVLGVPLMRAMRARYPDVRLHMVEGMSGHLAGMLRSSELDIAVLFGHRSDAVGLRQPGDGAGRAWHVQTLAEEELFLIRRCSSAPWPEEIAVASLKDEPLILPTGPHGLRSTLDAAFARAGILPTVVLDAGDGDGCGRRWPRLDTAALGRAGPLPRRCATVPARALGGRCGAPRQPPVQPCRRGALSGLSRRAGGATRLRSRPGKERTLAGRRTRRGRLSANRRNLVASQIVIPP